MNYRDLVFRFVLFDLAEVIFLLPSILCSLCKVDAVSGAKAASTHFSHISCTYCISRAQLLTACALRYLERLACSVCKHKLGLLYHLGNLKRS